MKYSWVEFPKFKNDEKSFGGYIVEFNNESIVLADDLDLEFCVKCGVIVEPEDGHCWHGHYNECPICGKETQPFEYGPGDSLIIGDKRSIAICASYS